MSVYLDLPLLAGLFGLIQDMVLLWTVAQICSLRVSFQRFFLGGLVGGVFQFFLQMHQATKGLHFEWVLAPLNWIVIVPGLMLFVVFFSPKQRFYGRIIGYFYLISFLLAGIHWGIDAFNQLYLGWEISLWWRFILHMILIFILGELGWGVVHRGIWEKLCLYLVEIEWDSQKVQLNALLDSGNHLYDPLTKLPVIIVEFASMKPFLPQEIINFAKELTSLGGENSLDLLSDSWQKRIRLLPFNSVGKTEGLLIGFRPDFLKIKEEGRERLIKGNHIVIGLCDHSLSTEGTFQALLPPTIL